MLTPVKTQNQPLTLTPGTVTVAVVEDDPTLCAMLCSAIEAQAGMHVVASFAAVGPAVAWLLTHSVDVLLTDLGLPDGSGIEVIKACASRYPQCDIMVITLFGDEKNVLAAIDAGAVGYILKDGDDLDICKFITDLQQGGSPISPLVARKLLSRVPGSKNHAQTVQIKVASNTAGLTPRELATLDLIARGYTYNEVAGLLSLAVGTVQTHIKRIYAKLSVHSRGEAVFEAHKLGLLQTGLMTPDRH